MSDEPKFISITQCADRKGLTRAAIHKAIQKGSLSAIKIGNTWAIKEEDCEGYTPEPPQQSGRRGAEKRWSEKD